MSARPWFEVDRQGLAKVLERRGRAFAVLELAQNALDADQVTRVDVTLEPVAGRPQATITVVDDSPKGFVDLSSAYTLHGVSASAKDPAKRGRFCAGEKLVLALCDEAEIVSTTGGLRFDDEGRTRLRRHTERGSVVRGTMPMTRSQLHEVHRALRRLIVPEGVTVVVNGEPLPRRVPIATPGKLEQYLVTEWANDAGVLERRERWTEIRIYEPLPGEKAAIFELGIPVVDLESDKYDVDILQKTPLNLDRDGLPASYITKVRATVLNATADRLTAADAAAPWARDAAESWLVDRDALDRALTLRFGVNRFADGPGVDSEAKREAVSQGATIVAGGSLSGGEWEQAKRHGLLPAVPPIAKTFVGYTDMEPHTAAMQRLVDVARCLSLRAWGQQVKVAFIASPDATVIADFNRDKKLIRFNVAHPELSGLEAEGPLNARVMQTLIHELAHWEVSDHLSREFYDACCRVGAHAALLAVSEAELWWGAA